MAIIQRLILALFFSVVCGHANAEPAKSSVQEWYEARGIFRHIALRPDGMVELTYGSKELRVMSVAEFEQFVRDRIVGYTIVDGYRLNGPEKGQMNAIVNEYQYFAPDGRLGYQGVVSPKASVGHWALLNAPPHMMPPDMPLLALCRYRSRDLGYDPTVSEVSVDNCVTAYSAISNIYGKKEGDVFGLLGNEHMAHRALTGTPWPDGTPSIPDKAPHE